jgi:hypothetical protein
VGRLYTVIIHAATAPETLTFAGSGVVPLREPRPTRICYHIINNYLYAGSYDVEFYEQALSETH